MHAEAYDMTQSCEKDFLPIFFLTAPRDNEAHTCFLPAGAGRNKAQLFRAGLLR